MLVGIVLVFALSYLDAAWDEQNIAATIVIAPFLTAMFTGARQTAVVAVFAIVAGVLSGGYNSNYGSNDYFVRLAVVIAGATFAVMAARSRRALADDRHRLRLLRGAAQIADTAVEIPDVVDRVGTLLVPAFADICVIDVLRGSEVERLGVVAHGPDAARIEARLRARGPWTLEAITAGQPLLVAHVDEAHLRRNARGEEDLEFLRSLRERSHINVPLRSRGRNVGTLALLSTSHPYGESDLELSILLAGMIGLALDNAGLFAELEALQGRLTTALDTLAEAVTIQDESGGLVYANEAAAASLGFATPAELLATPPREIVAASSPSTRTVHRCASRGSRRGACSRALSPSRCSCAPCTGPRGGTLADREGDGRAGARGRAAARRDRDRGRHRGQARRAGRALPGPGQRAARLDLDYEQTLAKVAALAVPRLADWCAVTLPAGERLRPVAVAHSDPDKIAFARAYQERYPTARRSDGRAQVLRDGVSQLVNRIDDAMLETPSPIPSSANWCARSASTPRWSCRWWPRAA